jgi:hypothetical protein
MDVDGEVEVEVNAKVMCVHTTRTEEQAKVDADDQHQLPNVASW